MNRVIIMIPFICGSIFCSCLFSCKDKENGNTPSSSFSYVVSDSLQTWCKNKFPPNRVSSEGTTVKLLFFEEELNHLWKPVYDEREVQALAAKANFQWQELPVHEGNRRWELSLNLQAEDSTYATPNNLLLYLFR